MKEPSVLTRIKFGFIWAKDCYCEWWQLMKAKPEVLGSESTRYGMFWFRLNWRWN